jgi:alpha-L-fucosidase
MAVEGKMGFNRREFLTGSVALLALARLRAEQRGSSFFRGDIPSGPFLPDWESLKAYRCPDWFRDAKFGIWAHWDPQCVPEQGDWYARHMYEQGHPDYEYHVKHYGHPSVFGWKDICHLWKAERWDPEALIKLYKKAGAGYLVALANHHDNFDCWNSRYQPWNAVNVGPKRDIVGTWAKTARAHGLRFGVSYHATPHRTWDEFLPFRYQSDATGPLAGVPYDGVMTKADGKGKWWEGMDPQMLNGTPHLKNAPCPEFVKQFMLRVQDVIDSYDLDLLTFDDGAQFVFDDGGNDVRDLKVWLGIPDLAPQIMAYFYNANMRFHRGKLEGVLDLKEVPEPVWGTLTRDFEMNLAGSLQATPWQTEACIGEWHYKRSLYENHSYKTAAMMVPLLVDIVSKNGNLLLSIPLPGDGQPDEDEMKFLDELGKWNAVNGEAIQGTRPWKIFGEGPTTHRRISDYQLPTFTAGDIRFTQKGDVLYAIALGWPEEGRLAVKSLGSDLPYYEKRMGKVELLGSGPDLKWSRNGDGLSIALPKQRPCDYAYAFKISPA